MITATLPIKPPPTDPATVEILDAALEVLESLGIRKATIEDIARHASVDRITVYRRLGTKNDVVAAVLGREAQRVFERATASAARAKTAEDRVATIFTDLVLDLRGNALFKRLMTVDPEATLPQVASEAGDLLRLAVEFATTVLLDGVEVADPRDLMARVEIVVRLVHSLFLTPEAAVALNSRAQLMRFARSYVAPIVGGLTVRWAGMTDAKRDLTGVRYRALDGVADPARVARSIDLATAVSLDPGRAVPSQTRGRRHRGRDSAHIPHGKIQKLTPFEPKPNDGSFSNPSERMRTSTTRFMTRTLMSE